MGNICQLCATTDSDYSLTLVPTTHTTQHTQYSTYSTHTYIAWQLEEVHNSATSLRNSATSLEHKVDHVHLTVGDTWQLPEAVLRHCLGFALFTLRDVLRVTTVCREWQKQLAICRLNLVVNKQVDDLGLNLLTALKGLQSLVMEGCSKVTDAGLGTFVHLNKLVNLSIVECFGISDDGLPAIAYLNGLHTLDLSKCRFEGEGLRTLSELTSLRSLTLRSCAQITDSNLTFMHKLVGLQTLDLAGSVGVTGTGLRCLTELPMLTHLALHGCFAMNDHVCKQGSGGEELVFDSLSCRLDIQRVYTPLVCHCSHTIGALFP